MDNFVEFGPNLWISGNTAALCTQMCPKYNALNAGLYNRITATVVLKGQQDFELLEGVDRLAFESWMHEFVSTFSGVYSLTKQNVLRPAVRDTYERWIRWMFQHQGVREWWYAEDRIPIPADTTARIGDLINGL